MKRYSNTNVISTEKEMTDAIRKHDLITTAIDWANDRDYNWEYNTPESFSAFAESIFEDELVEWLEDLGYTVEGDPMSLVSSQIWEDLITEATSGDFGDYDDDIYTATSIMSGRDSNKSYNDLQIRNWTTSKRKLLNQIDKALQSGNKHTIDELKRGVRSSISEAEGLISKLNQYLNTLEDFNRSSASETDIQDLNDALKSFEWGYQHNQKRYSRNELKDMREHEDELMRTAGESDYDDEYYK